MTSCTLPAGRPFFASLCCCCATLKAFKEGALWLLLLPELSKPAESCYKLTGCLVSTADEDHLTSSLVWLFTVRLSESRFISLVQFPCFPHTYLLLTFAPLHPLIQNQWQSSFGTVQFCLCRVMLFVLWWPWIVVTTERRRCCRTKRSCDLFDQ